MQGNWGAALSALTPLLIGMLVTFIACCVLLVFAIRITTRDKIMCTFHKNHRKASALLKYDATNGCVWLGKEDDPNREKYIVSEDEIEWIEWPGMLPHMFCVTLRSLDFVRGIPIAIHPEKRAVSNISAKSLRLQSDGNVLQAVYLHARQSLRLDKGRPLSMLVTILLLAVVAVSVFGTYKSMQTSSDTAALRLQMQEIRNAMGITATPAKPGTPPPQGSR